MEIDNHTTKHIIPMLAVADMKETIDFYTSILKFEVLWESIGYSVLKSGDSKIHLKSVEDEKVVNFNREYVEYYIEVEGIESLWGHVKEFKDKYKTRELFERDYGMKEFHIIDPNGCLIFVGEEIKKA